MNQLNVFGYVSGNLGYNVHLQGLIEGCISNGIDVRTCPDEQQIQKELSNQIKNSIKKGFDPTAPSLRLSYGNEMHNFYGKKRIGMSVWETTRLPEDWVPELNSLDEVWTVSKFCKKAFEDSGINKDVKIVNEGVDTTIFNPYVSKPQMFDNHFKDKFVFLSIGKWEERKGFDILLKAFTDEFKPDEKVALMIQGFNPFLKNFNPYEYVFNMNLGKHAEITFLPPVASRYDVAKYYISSDCFVLPTKGEAWGLPITEALACGRPVITTKWGGAMDYMSEKYGWLIDVEKMEEPKSEIFAGYDKHIEGNEWAVPSQKHLQELIRYAFENKEECKKKGGTNSYNFIDENYTWEKSTEIIKELLK